jgi:hypothetical protein
MALVVVQGFTFMSLSALRTHRAPIQHVPACTKLFQLRVVGTVG